MKKASEQKNRPNIQFVRDWLRYYESRYGETPQVDEITKLIDYTENLEEEFDSECVVRAPRSHWVV